MYESMNAFNTVLNNQKKKENKTLIRQNRPHTFFKKPQVRSEALAVQVFSRPSWSDVLHVRCVLCDRAAAVELSAEDVNTSVH